MPRFLVPSALLSVGLGLWVGGCTAPKKEPATGRVPASAQALQAVLPHFDQEWAMRKYWEDGLAEVATYAAQRTVYKKKRTFEFTLITVKEEFNQRFNVKTDDYQRKDLFPLMKINQFCQITTDQYPYHYLTSLFFRRDQPVALYKMTTSSQEWCGNTFKAIVDDGVNFAQTFNSYWLLLRTDCAYASERHLSCFRKASFHATHQSAA